METQLSAESQQTPSPSQGEARNESSSVDDGSGSDSDSGSSLESGDKSESEMESSAGPVAPSESSPDLPSRENLSEAQVNQKQDSQKPGAASEEPRTAPSSKRNRVKKKAAPSNSEKTEKQVPKNKRTLRSLRDFPLQEIFPKWYRDSKTSISRQALSEFDIKNNIDGFVTLLHNVANLIHNLDLGEDHFIYNLLFHCKQYCKNNPGGPEITIEKFDDYLYRWAMKVCPRALI